MRQKSGVGQKNRSMTYEYHSQAEYSAVISNDNVRKPEWVVFEFDIRVLR